MTPSAEHGKGKPSEFVTDLDKGLSSDEVHKRRVLYGMNAVPEEKRHPLRDFAKRFWGLTAWMLELTMAISLVLGKLPKSLSFRRKAKVLERFAHVSYPEIEFSQP